MEIISKDINLAKKLLTENQVIAIPTETVYGLAADINNEEAITKIFTLKERPHFNPLIVHIGRMQDITLVAKDIPEAAWDLIQNFWPGPLTLLLPKREIVSDLITAGKPTVAVRMPNHSLTRKLIQELQFPVAAPSANPFNHISPTTAEHVYHYFKGKIPMILDGGKCEEGLESTIIGFDKDEAIIYRLGAISVEEIESIIGKVRIIDKIKPSDIQAPGMLSKHYAPKTPLYLSKTISEQKNKWKGKKVAFISFKPMLNYMKDNFVLSPSGNLKEAAASLYSVMHKVDQMNYEAIVTEYLPNIGIGRSINDRLTRAAHSLLK